MQVAFKIELLKRGIRQGEVARGIGMQPSRLSRIISGRVPARARDRRRIAQFLAVAERRLFPNAWRGRRGWRKP